MVRELETPDDSQKVCNVGVEKNWTRVVSAGHGIPHGCLYRRRIDQTVKRIWGRREVVDTASALGHCLGCVEASELWERRRQEKQL